jgi:hypothetical protein
LYARVRVGQPPVHCVQMHMFINAVYLTDCHPPLLRPCSGEHVLLVTACGKTAAKYGLTALPAEGEVREGEGGRERVVTKGD